MAVLSEILHFIIELDVRMTNSFVSLLMQWASFQSLRIHCKFLEVSCDGIAWLSSWIAFIWLFNSEPLFEMQLNMLVGLLLDIVVIALLKALVRRRRPVSDRDVLTIGPDKYSFPSGHASRSFFVLLFFSKLYALPLMVRVPMTAWAVTIAISRLILRRHYILDVWVGAVLGICEAYFIKLVWIRQETAANVIKYISEDNVPGGVE
ncbi:phospholipid phosphatase 6 [Drosophila willistoni]|uniref:phospholipid phosphatase 6 n=1 Tax=Drosophila willistoni TaxID=7260 RepID=UPI000C26C70E|nr:phospholipid phosphatase 6 [Drosophila willistoni]